MDRLSRSIGQQVVVENRPGGGNVIGALAAARAEPDGYNFFFATAAALVTNPYTFKSLPYDAQNDFIHRDGRIDVHAIPGQQTPYQGGEDVAVDME